MSGSNWLNYMVQEKLENCKLNDMYVHPDEREKNANNTPNKYDLHNIENNKEQTQLIYMVLKTIKEYMEFPEKFKNDSTIKFEPMYITVMGKGGTGKSYVITLIRLLLNKLFGNKENLKISMVNAPTGAAACNAKGTTCHNAWSINVHNEEKTRDDALQNKMNQLCHLLFLCIDERSMLSNRILGKMEQNARSIVHCGCNRNKLFGGIPVILLCGDDEQLPPVISYGKGHGIFNYFRKKNSDPLYSNHLDLHGEDIFFKMTENVIELKQIRRISENDTNFAEILDDLRGDGIKYNDAKKLLDLHVSNLSFEKNQWLEENAVFLFATNERKDYYNMKRLCKIASPENPVLLCQPIYKNTFDESKKGYTKHFNIRDLPQKCLLCDGSIVALKGRNFDPSTGLYNGALGRLIGKRFQVDTFPSDNHLPLYCIVYFPEYTGPAWIQNHPKWVPIPPVTQYCKIGCCKVTYMPLTLAFARTNHTFQGKEAGPDKTIPAVVVDVGTSKFEAINPGLLYTALSRATTLGNFDKDKSALYLSGPVSIDRITNVKFKRNGKNKGNKYDKIIQKEKWVQHLNKQKSLTRLIPQQELPSTMVMIKDWIKNTTYNMEQLNEVVDFHKNISWQTRPVDKPTCTF